MKLTAQTALIGVTVLLATSACTKVQVRPDATPMLTQAEATAIQDKIEGEWTSMDAKRIDALYATDIVGFDMTAPPLSTDRANWTKLQEGFASLKLDKSNDMERKIQVLDADTFVASGTTQMSSTTEPKNDFKLRWTDVYQKQADGKWLIVNEHVSAVPKA